MHRSHGAANRMHKTFIHVGQGTYLYLNSQRLSTATLAALNSTCGPDSPNCVLPSASSWASPYTGSAPPALFGHSKTFIMVCLMQFWMSMHCSCDPTAHKPAHAQVPDWEF